MKRYTLGTVSALSLSLVAGCQMPGDGTASGPKSGSAATLPTDAAAKVDQAIAVLHPLSDSKVAGTVTFTQSGNGVRVQANVTGLKPNATHGFHVHQYGDCSDMQKGESAGGHYNPTNHPHAGPDADHRHAGDFGNLKADAQGKATYDMTFKDISIAGGQAPVLGRALIVHSGEDDLKSQPTGNAGGRIACGVVGVKNPK